MDFKSECRFSPPPPYPFSCSFPAHFFFFLSRRTARRAFWYVLSCAVGVWLVKWLQNVEGVGMVWVFLSAVLAASVVEDEVAKKTGLTPLNIEATQRLRAIARTPEAQGKAERIMDIVASITRGKGYTAGTKQLVSRVSGTTKRLQRALYSIFSLSTPLELNYILCAINMAATVEVADQATMQLLIKDKLPLLSTIARAALVDGLQKLGLRYRPQRQLWARDVILQTHGLDLTHFKAYIDDGGDYHTMYKLVYNDLQGGIQNDVLEHLKREGEAVVAVVQGSGPGAPPGAVLKVLSDIDDTVFSSGDSFPAGVDARYPRKCYYPGALALYAALDRCFAQKYSSLLQMIATVGVIAAAAEEGEGENPGSDDSDEEITSPPEKKTPPTTRTPKEEQRMKADEGIGDKFTSREIRDRREAEERERERDTSPSPPTLPTDGSYDNKAFNKELTPSPFNGGQGGGHVGDDGGSAESRSSISNARLLGLNLPSVDVSGLTPRDPGVFFDGFSPRADSPLPERCPQAALSHHQEGSNLVFLSARPESYKGMTESESYRKYFQPPVLRGELDTSPTMLLGSLDSGPRALMKLLTGRWMLPHDDPNPKTAAAALYQTLAAKKLSRFREYSAIYPEAAFVFVGDNGQGDVLCAEILYSTAAQAATTTRPSQLIASFIHRVVSPASTLSMLRTAKGTKADWMTSWQQRRIYFHRTHVGMAAEAFKLGLLDEEGLSLVANTAAIDFRRIYGRYGGRHAGRNLDKAARHLNKDIIAANILLPSHLDVALVQMPGERGTPALESVRAPSVALSDMTGLAPMR
ncbi:hypothetical protein KSW81_001514 [Nannochloris sp. 'desiccata']|nr:hypothetical protein KSW81_001514 [Chlorella desiccata (nom. nud.)]